MTFEEIKIDISKKLGFTITSNKIKNQIQEHLINAPFSSITCWVLATGVGKTRPALLKIQNRKNFVFDIKVIHPDSPKYIPYWREEKRRIIGTSFIIIEISFISPSVFLYLDTDDISSISSKN